MKTVAKNKSILLTVHTMTIAVMLLLIGFFVCTAAENTEAMAKTQPVLIMLKNSSIGEEAVSITGSNASGRAGDTVNMQVNISDSPNLSTLEFKVDYPSSVLTLISAVLAGGSGIMLEAPPILNSNTVFCLVPSGVVDYNPNEVILNLSFKITESAGPGAYTVAFSELYAGEQNDVFLPSAATSGTVTASKGQTISGNILTYNPQNATTVQLMQGEKITYTTTVAAIDGYGQIEQTFVFNGVEPGTYTLVISKSAHATFTVTNIIVDGADIDLTKDSRPAVKCMTLLRGDFNGDNLVDVKDLNTLWSSLNYGRRASDAADPRCDLNGDGLIDVKDLNILWSSENYGRRGPII